MVSWDSLIRFVAEDSAEYWASLAMAEFPTVGLQVEGFGSIEDLESDKGAKKVTVKKVRAFKNGIMLPINSLLSHIVTCTYAQPDGSYILYWIELQESCRGGGGLVV